MLLVDGHFRLLDGDKIASLVNSWHFCLLVANSEFDQFVTV